MEERYKIVEFDRYCGTCKHRDDKDSEVCDECLYEPARVDSHKPINYEEA